MKYEFDVVIDRRGSRAAKYDELMKKFGTDDIIPLWVADMDFRTAKPIIDACEKKAQEGLWGYTSRPSSYFEAVANWERKRYGWEPDTGLMSYALGVVQSIGALIKLHTAPNDKILIQTPVYSEFYDVPEALERVIIENPLSEKDGGWSIDFDDFEEKVKECKMFLLCSPHNPLGIVWTAEELKRMADICRKYHVMLVSDEIHSDLVFHGKKHIRTATLSKEINESVITCVSVTKTFNLAGLQASTVIFPNKDLKKSFDHYWGSMDIHRNNAFSSVAMEAAYNEGEEWLEQLLIYLSENFDFVADYCKTYIPEIKPNIPDATYLIWLNCRELGLNNEKLREFMIKEAKLGLNEGWTFGRSLSGFMRLNAACPRSVLEKAMLQLRNAVDGLSRN